MKTSQKIQALVKSCAFTEFMTQEYPVVKKMTTEEFHSFTDTYFTATEIADYYDRFVQVEPVMAAISDKIKNGSAKFTFQSVRKMAAVISIFGSKIKMEAAA